MVANSVCGGGTDKECDGFGADPMYNNGACLPDDRVVYTPSWIRTASNSGYVVVDDEFVRTTVLPSSPVAQTGRPIGTQRISARS